MVRISLKIFFAAFFMLIFVWNCKKNTPADFSNLPVEVNPYIYAYTSGVISKADPIRILFAKSIISPEQIGEEAEKGILSFSPSIKGVTSWEDEKTLIFQPESWLNSGKDYTGSIKLNKVLDGVPKEDQVFNFNFRTRDLYFQVDFSGLNAPDPNNLKQQELNGFFNTSDVAKNEEVEKLLNASQNRK